MGITWHCICPGLGWIGQNDRAGIDRVLGGYSPLINHVSGCIHNQSNQTIKCEVEVIGLNSCRQIESTPRVTFASQTCNRHQNWNVRKSIIEFVHEISIIYNIAGHQIYITISLIVFRNNPKAYQIYHRSIEDMCTFTLPGFLGREEAGPAVAVGDDALDVDVGVWAGGPELD